MSENHRQFSQSEYLSILSHATAQAVKDQAESVLPVLGDVKVLVNRTGLVMLPYTDNARGTIFHLGEVLVSEAHIRLASGVEGYGVCMGRDLVQALGIAVLDAALTANIMTDEITAFIAEQSHIQQQADSFLLRSVESTRVEMQTF
jgi:alpha-D-ribose 1-methylphosphonate 5-triphosphate synthase subunit PhnG